MMEILRELWAALRELKVMLRHLGIYGWRKSSPPKGWRDKERKWCSWSSGGEVTCKESRQSPGAKEHEKTAQPFLLFLISCCFFPLAKPNWKPEAKQPGSPSGRGQAPRQRWPKGWAQWWKRQRLGTGRQESIALASFRRADLSAQQERQAKGASARLTGQKYDCRDG